jgi:hypothetical protein
MQIQWFGGSYEAAMSKVAEHWKEQRKFDKQVKRIADSWQRSDGMTPSEFDLLLRELEKEAIWLLRDYVEQLTRDILRALDHRAGTPIEEQ